MTCNEVEQSVFRKVAEQAEQSGTESSKKEVADELDHGRLVYNDLDSSDDSDGGVSISLSPPSPVEASKSLHKDLRLRGMQKAKNREMVRQAGRRGTTLGFLSWDEGPERALPKVEAVQNGRVVEASFAKGDWGVRWKS